MATTGHIIESSSHELELITNEQVETLSFGARFFKNPILTGFQKATAKEIIVVLETQIQFLSNHLSSEKEALSATAKRLQVKYASSTCINKVCS